MESNLVQVESDGGGMLRLIEAAITQDLALEKLEKLLELQERFDQRVAEKAFHRAKAAFQVDCPPIPHDCKAVANGITWTYASLGQICQTVGPVAGRHGLVWHWEDDESGERRKRVCVLTHELGHSERSSFLLSTEGQKGGLSGMTEQQKEGSADTYAKSRTLQAVLGIGTAQDDTDGLATYEADDPTNPPKWLKDAIKVIWREWEYAEGRIDLPQDGETEDVAERRRERMAKSFASIAPAMESWDQIKQAMWGVIELMKRDRERRDLENADTYEKDGSSDSDRQGNSDDREDQGSAGSRVD